MSFTVVPGGSSFPGCSAVMLAPALVPPPRSVGEVRLQFGAGGHYPFAGTPASAVAQHSHVVFGARHMPMMSFDWRALERIRAHRAEGEALPGDGDIITAASAFEGLNPGELPD